jgi:HEPN domain-containing protein
MTEPPDEQQRLAQEWLALAEEDLSLAQELHAKSSHLLSLCFHAQQAAEKFLKALLAHRRIAFNRTHDIENLVNRLPEELGNSLRLHDILDLTEYAVDTRYPFNSFHRNHAC